MDEIRMAMEDLKVLMAYLRVVMEDSRLETTTSTSPQGFEARSSTIAVDHQSPLAQSIV